MRKAAKVNDSAIICYNARSLNQAVVVQNLTKAVDKVLWTKLLVGVVSVSVFM